MRPEIALIVATARNGVIGRDNALPWHCPSDLRHFKALTMGKAMIMGRKTWDSIGKPLPGRVSIVVSSSSGLTRGSSEYVHFTTSLPEAITAAQTHPLVENRAEIMIIGGAQIYATALPYATKIYRTLIEADVAGDAFFPELPAQWNIIDVSAPFQCDKDEFPLIFQTWRKI